MFEHIPSETIAIIDGEVEMTYGEMLDRARGVAAYVNEQFPEATAVGVRCDNRIEFAELVFGIVMSGRDAVLIPTFVPDFVSEIMKAYVGFEDIIGMGYALDPELGYDLVGSYEAESLGTLVFMTSGSTGMPKLVRFPEKVFYTTFDEEVEFLGLGPGVRVLSVAPALLTAVPTFNYGSSLILMREKPTSDRIKEFMHKYAPESFFASPSLLDRCIADGVFDEPVSSLRTIMSAASKMPEHVVKWCREQDDYKVFDVYASSESGAISMNEVSSEKPRGLMTPGLEIELRDLDENGIGQIYFKGRDAASGFYEDEGLRRPEGWQTNGDFCRFVDTEAGRSVEIVARSTDKLKVHGFTVYPSVIEKALVQNSLAADALVTFTRGQTNDEIQAEVVSHLTEDKVREALLEFVPRFCVPSVIRVVPEIDRSKVESGRFGRATREEAGRAGNES